MEHNNDEVMNIEKALADAAEKQLSELNDLQLASVGGGIGIVDFH
jgi:hypothetical protein